MRLSKLFFQSYRELPSDAQIVSHQLLHRAGFIQKSAAGLYNYSHLMCRVLEKTERIIREELAKVDAVELSLSVVTPSELWKESDRWDELGDLMLRATDRSGRDICISPTNEEAVVDYFRKIAKSYKQLPVCLYQINTKFRDEIRPRFGLMRAREFSMKDAYSFHIDKKCLDQYYDAMYGAYQSIFSRLGLDVIAVQADGGAMAGSGAKTHEFQVLAESGEDTLVYCPAEQSGSNLEAAQTKRASVSRNMEAKPLEAVSTIDMSTLKSVSDYLEIPEEQCIKACVFVATVSGEDHIVLSFCLGDDTINELKLSAVLGASHLRSASSEECKSVNLVEGYIGPFMTDPDNGPCWESIKAVVDTEVGGDAYFVIGANAIDTHYKQFNFKRDSSISFIEADIRLAKEDDLSLDGNPLEFKRGIEVGHIFQLGDTYTKGLNASVLNHQGKAMFPLMGCYGIGVGRTVAAAIEQSHDESGIIWPRAIAPYDIIIIGLGKKDAEIQAYTEQLYTQLRDQKKDVLLDDRDLSPGVKFKDADLIGIPLQIVVGKSYKNEGQLECVLRSGKKKELVNVSKILDYVEEVFDEPGGA